MQIPILTQFVICQYNLLERLHVTEPPEIRKWCLILAYFKSFYFPDPNISIFLSSLNKTRTKRSTMRELTMKSHQQLEKLRFC